MSIAPTPVSQQPEKIKNKIRGAILLAYQAKWTEDQAQVKVAVKGRREGFSWAEAGASVIHASKTNGGNVYYISYDKEMTAGFIEDCAWWAKLLGQAIDRIEEIPDKIMDDPDRDILNYKIYFSSGFVISTLSSSPRKLRSKGRPRERVIIDEAAFVDDLKELLKAAMAITVWGGSVHVISTHNGENSEFNLLVRDIEMGIFDYSLHFVPLDVALADGLFKRICEVTDKEWSPEAQQEWLESMIKRYAPNEMEELYGIPSASTGAYFTRVILEQCMVEGIPRLRFEKKTEWVTDNNRLKETQEWIRDNLKPVIDNMEGLRSVYGQDFGRTNDLTVIWVLQDIGGGRWRQAFAVELRNIPFDVQKTIAFYILDEIPLFHHAVFDSRGNGSDHAEAALQKYGDQKITRHDATTNSYAEYFPKYRAAYEDKSIIIGREEDYIADHRIAVLKKGKPSMGDGRIKGQDGKYRHGDSTIAGLNAWIATLTEGQPPAGESVDDDNIRETYRPNSARGRSFFGKLFGAQSVMNEDNITEAVA